MTSAIQVQCSNNWAVKPPGSWPVFGVHNDEDVSEQYEIYLHVYIWTAEKLYEDMIDCRSYNYTQLKQYWKLSMKKFGLEQGFMTFVIPVQCSTNWVLKPAGSWPGLVVQNWWRYKWIFEYYVFWTAEKHIKTWMITTVILKTYWAVVKLKPENSGLAGIEHLDPLGFCSRLECADLDSTFLVIPWWFIKVLALYLGKKEIKHLNASLHLFGLVCLAVWQCAHTGKFLYSLEWPRTYM